MKHVAGHHLEQLSDDMFPLPPEAIVILSGSALA
jgi:hypothetical protein